MAIPDGLHTNRAPSGQPNSHLTAVNNYLSANAATEDLTRAPDSTSTNLVAVHEPNLPLEASRIIFGSGLRDRAAADDDHAPVGAALSVPDGQVGPSESVTVTAALENFDAARSATSVSTTLTGPEGWTITPAPDQPDTIAGGDSVTAGWTVTAPERPTSTAPQEFTATIGYTYRSVPFVATRTFTLTQR